MDDEGYVRVDGGRCDLCAACVAVCAPLALFVAAGRLNYEAARCTSCGDCLLCCPREALSARA